MIAPSSMAFGPREVTRTDAEPAHLLFTLQGEASGEVEAVFAEVSGKRINAALMSGITRHGISRAIHGCPTNPLARLVGWFVLARKLGIPKERLQRMIDWLQDALDRAYGDAPEEELSAVLDKDAELDGKDDLPRQRAARGDKRAMPTLLEVKQEQLAHTRKAVTRLRMELGRLG